MKTLVALTLAGILLLTSVTAALASHGTTTPEAAPVPAHGSVWFGSGLASFDSANVQPLHGSIWFGSGLQHFGMESSPANSPDVAMIRRGFAGDRVAPAHAEMAMSPAGIQNAVGVGPKLGH